MSSYCEDVRQYDFLSEASPSSAQRSSKAGAINIQGREVETTPVFEAYWRFAAERQRIFFNRLARANAPRLTSDPVLARYKFTNAYRASDRVSQFLIRRVIYREDLPQSDEEIFFRIMLFKFFNKIETWTFLEEALGPITLATYRFEAFDSALASRMVEGSRIYSAAYIMPSAGGVFGRKYKHQNHLLLLERMLDEAFPEKLRACGSMGEVYGLMASAPSIGKFLAYQYATDVNYSLLTNFPEDDFVVAGPGALDGVGKCFRNLGGISAEDIIRVMYERQDEYFRAFGVAFPSLWGRPLQLIDCQNLFCEISKYARVAFPEIEGVSGRTRIKQKFAPARSLPTPFYPPKWGLNEKIAEEA